MVTPKEAKKMYNRKVFRRILETKKDGSIILGPEDEQIHYSATEGFVIVSQGRPIGFLKKEEVITILKEATYG